MTRARPGGGKRIHGLPGISRTNMPAPTRNARVTISRADGSTIRLGGRRALLMRSLISAGSRGITSLDAWPVSTRLASFIHELRRRQGLNIQTLREQHDGGWHARYVLRSLLTVHAVR